MTLESLQGKLRVFDTGLYIDLDPEVRPIVVQEDLAGIVIEAGDRPLQERINARRLKIVDGAVHDPKTGKNVLTEFAIATYLNRKETEGATTFYADLVQGKIGTLVFQLSPSGGLGGYKESRVNVALRTGESDIEFYGIPSHLSPNSLLNYATKLTEWSDVSLPKMEPEDLRSIAIPITVPTGENPWVFLEKAVPLDSGAWDAIFQDMPWYIKDKAEKDAGWVAREMSARLSVGTSELERVSIGAWGERMMQSMGWALNPLACPGLFNSQILSQMDSFDPNQSMARDILGNLRLTESKGSEGGKFIKNCGNVPECGKPINKRMNAGDLCPHCGKIYKGC